MGVSILGALVIIAPPEYWLSTEPYRSPFLVACGGVVAYAFLFGLIRFGLAATLSFYGVVVAAYTVHRLKPGWLPIPSSIFDAVHGAAYVALFFLCLVPTTTLGDIIFRRIKRFDADALLTDRLIQIVAMVDSRPVEWDVLQFRVMVAKELETVATVLERDLYHRWRSNDAVLGQWVRERTKSLADEIRGLKRWLVTPRADTRVHFLERLSRILVCVVESNWDGIPREESEPASQKQRWYARAKEVFVGVLTACVPIGILWILPKLRVSVPESAKAYVFVGAFVWAAVALIVAVDPLYSVKFDAVKTVLSWAGKKKE